jgi:hypothetical protein
MYITPPRGTFRNKYSALSNLDFGFDFPEKENYRVTYRVIGEKIQGDHINNRVIEITERVNTNSAMEPKTVPDILTNYVYVVK